MRIYHPDVGSMAMTCENQPKRALERILQKMSGLLKDFRVAEIRTPSVVPSGRQGS
jgi:hypothetical protein